MTRLLLKCLALYKRLLKKVLINLKTFGLNNEKFEECNKEFHNIKKILIEKKKKTSKVLQLPRLD